MGTLRRKAAQEKGMTIDEFNALGETDKSTDTMVDEYQKKLGETEDNFIIEGRTCWLFIPHSFKVYLACDPMEAAKRIFAEQNCATDRTGEMCYRSVEETAAELAKRVESDVRRYHKYYDVDYRDPKHYDLVVDTTHNPNSETTANQILAALQKKNPA